MFETALLALFGVFTPSIFGFMILGVCIGIIVGILPGVGPIFSLAILIPFTFSMDAAPAFALLLGAHATSYTGGAITTVLLNTPGDPGNAATLFDGFPMTQKGEGGRALGAALTSSALGGVIGACFLILLIPVMRSFVLLFAPPEFFMMAFIGIAFIAIISGKYLLKGLISGGFGLMLGLVGLDWSTSIERFTFGALSLWDGIPLVPVGMGLFAVAEMIELAVEGGSITEKFVPSQTGGVLRGVKDTFRHWWLVLRCSMIGNVVGAIPGIGANVATFISYGHARQTAKNPDLFGTGVVAGVIAPESANNAKEGGSLVPTLAFGIPGSAGMAILLGAFYIQGIETGPVMLAKNLPFVFSMAWTVALANIFAAGFCLIFAKQMARVAFLPGGYLFPLVLLLASIGAYSTRGNLTDLVLTLSFGLLGYAMKKYNWSRPVVIIGLVLARVAEKNLLLSFQLYRETFYQRPITILLIIIFLLTLVFSLRRKTAEGTGLSAYQSFFRQLFNLAAVSLLIFYVYTATGFNAKAKLMPLFVSIPVLILAIWQTLNDFRLYFSPSNIALKKEAVENAPDGDGKSRPVRELNVCLWVTSLYASLYLFGFMVTTFFYTLLSLKARSGYNWRSSLGVSLGALAFLALVLVYGFKVDLYTGSLVALLRESLYGY